MLTPLMAVSAQPTRTERARRNADPDVDPNPGAGSNYTNPPVAAPERTDRERAGAPAAGLSTKIHLMAGARCRPLARCSQTLAAASSATTLGVRHYEAGGEQRGQPVDRVAAAVAAAASRL
jgi:hypothetical protein